MMTLQILGLIIPELCLLFIYAYSIRECIKGNANEQASIWELILIILSVFIEGFTLGTFITL